MVKKLYDELPDEEKKKLEKPKTTEVVEEDTKQDLQDIKEEYKNDPKYVPVANFFKVMQRDVNKTRFFANQKGIILPDDFFTGSSTIVKEEEVPVLIKPIIKKKTEAEIEVDNKKKKLADELKKIVINKYTEGATILGSDYIENLKKIKTETPPKESKIVSINPCDFIKEEQFFEFKSNKFGKRRRSHRRSRRSRRRRLSRSRRSLRK
jgi:hypothetical protein